MSVTVVIAEAAADGPVSLQYLVATSHGRMESMGAGLPHRVSCDYCGEMRDYAELELAGMGVYMCQACRARIDAETRSGIFSFWQLLDFRLLRPASAASGAPVAVSVCPAPFSGLTRPNARPWWRQQAFWDRDRRMGDDLPNGLAWCRDQLSDWLSGRKAVEAREARLAAEHKPGFTQLKS